jgi:hypothetical protein
LLDPRATAKAKKVATKIIPARVRYMLALRRSIRCAAVAAFFSAVDEEREL